LVAANVQKVGIRKIIITSKTRNKLKTIKKDFFKIGMGRPYKTQH
jgi:hypothetical protein